MDNQKTIEQAVAQILQAVGEDAGREGLLKTPERVAKAYGHLLKGYNESADEVLNSAIFNESYSEMVIVKDIEVYSLCEHHMLPFFGKAHVAYIPDGKIIGLSKIPRVVDVFSKRLQVQERLTIEIRDSIQKALNPVGVAVVLDCHHLCMQMRGVSKQNSTTVTSAFSGEFLTNDTTRKEFVSLLQLKK